MESVVLSVVFSGSRGYTDLDNRKGFSVKLKSEKELKNEKDQQSGLL